VILATSHTYVCTFLNQSSENISSSKLEKELNSFLFFVFTFTETFFNFDKSFCQNFDTFESDTKEFKPSLSSSFKVSLFCSLVKSDKI
jgi:hypothetical protein